MTSLIVSGIGPFMAQTDTVSTPGADIWTVTELPLLHMWHGNLPCWDSFFLLLLIERYVQQCDLSAEQSLKMFGIFSIPILTQDFGTPTVRILSMPGQVPMLKFVQLFVMSNFFLFQLKPCLLRLLSSPNIFDKMLTLSLKPHEDSTRSWTINTASKVRPDIIAYLCWSVRYV